MSRESVVIIGAGQGGLQAAISLRQNGFAGAITLIGDEPGLPYQRPPLSKAYLHDGNAEALRLRPDSFFTSKEVDYLPETRVEQIDRAAQEIVIAGASGKRRLGYDHLILATGTRNLRPPIAGVERSCDLRTLRDAEILRARLSQPQRIAVIGGGFIGLEFAAVARKLGHEVSVIEAAPRLMARAVSSWMSDHFAALHRDWGTALHLGEAAVAVQGDGVTLANGTTIPAEFVLLAAGVRPNTELAEAAGLEIENGVKVDACLLSSDPAISALGDCACFPDPRTGRPVRLESVQAATDHARLIAARIAKGESAAYSALPWFWSDQGDRKLQIAGYADPDATEEAVAEGIVARFDAQGLAAVETVNNARVHMKARRLLASGAPVALDDLGEIVAA
ncbi:NAD(P)/FAD-dependent oxidoreductase [Thioclava atlantica]|uniref:Ferredoxin reductase n=1 Tax=Thioclava atlantica TaxID=1317124 RepID=A0A085TW23_9RHOB|nr:FAD-dependent oxidoreductase [Thioclava atlantica]KFE34920.1 ferredoxin reductase [Thioclava atlantica]